VSATAEVQKAQAALQDVPIMQKGREQSLATVSQISSVLGESQRQLGETEIRAPISGIVSKRYIEEGELVASLSSFSSGTAIVRIEDRRQMLVNLDVNEIDVARMATGMKAEVMATGMKAEVTVDAIPGRTFAGTVTKIAPASKSTAVQGQPVPTEAVVKYEVEIRLVAADPALRSGMSAKCSLEVVHKSGVLLLPSEYVGKDKKGRFVELPPATKEGKPERREIVAGSESGSSIEIMSGLKEGDRVQKPTYKGPERQGMMSMSDGEEGSGNAENKSEE
jgi:HlyD family secretion protein